MTQRTITIIISIFVLLVVGMFALAYFSRVDDTDVFSDTDVQNESPDTPYENITRIDAKHFYEDGTHTLAGEIMLPTPCDLLTYDATVAESMPEQVMVTFNVTNNAEVCAQVITAQRFLVSFDASEEAVIRARFMNRDVELNLIPPAEGETPEDFELYIKG